MNEENKKQIIILIVLFCILGFFIYKNIGKIAPSTPTPGTISAANLSGSVVPIDIFEDTDTEALTIDINVLTQKIQNVDFIYRDSVKGRNPSQPTTGTDIGPWGDDPNPPPPPPENLRAIAQLKKVTGIIWDETSPMAVVDDEVVHEGYEFKYGIVVKSIGVDHVVFSFETPDGETNEITKQLVKEQ